MIHLHSGVLCSCKKEWENYTDMEWCRYLLNENKKIYNSVCHVTWVERINIQAFICCIFGSIQRKKITLSCLEREFGGRHIFSIFKKYFKLS